MADDYRLLARWKLVQAASRNPQLSRGDIAVLIAVLDRINDAGVAWPGLSLVARDASMVRSSAVRSVKRLVEGCYLLRESGTRSTPNHYRMGTVGRCDLAPSRKFAPSRRDALGAGANGHVEVGAATHLEPAYKNLPIEPASKHEAGASAAMRPGDPVWGGGLQYLIRKGTPSKQARSFLGKLCKQVGDVPTIALLAQAESDDVVDPIPWLAKAAQSKAPPRGSRLPRDGRSDDELIAAMEADARRMGISA